MHKILRGWRFYLFSALFMLSATSFEAVGVYAQMVRAPSRAIAVDM